MQCCALVGALLAVLSVGPAAEARHRLPAGYQWGRCLLVVEDRTRISGPCAYKIWKGGDFHIQGPHQVYDGIDYPKAASMAAMKSRDYWAHVSREADGTWSAYGNSDIRAVHGDRPWEGLRRKGACYFNRQVRICLWAK